METEPMVSPAVAEPVETASAAPELHVVNILPSKGLASLELGELWTHRELLYFFVWRDLKVRYRQTALGAAWAIIQPLFAMLIFTIFFGKLAKVPSDSLPYPLFTYTALTFWTLCANGIGKGATSLVSNSALISKIYLPRLLIPAGTVISGLADFAVAFVLLLGMMVYYHIGITVNSLWVLPLLVLVVVATLGVTLWLSALNVIYRDVGYVVPFLVQLWMFATPVVYPSSLVPDRWRVFYGLNPLAGAIDGVRWSLLGSAQPPLSMLAVSVAVTIVLFISGAYYFRYVEGIFADVV